MKILVLTALYPPLGFSGHDERCRQTVNGLAARGHRVRVLTSNHRLPSVGLPGESGVSRRLQLSDFDKDDPRRHRFGSLLSHEKHNLRTLDSQLDAFKPDAVLVWNMNRLSKSLVVTLHEMGIPVVFDLHSCWPVADLAADPWVAWWRGDGPAGRKLRRALMGITGAAGRARSAVPVAGPEALRLGSAYCCSRFLCDRLAAAGIPVEGCEVQYPATDESGIPAKIRFDEPLHFVWAGQISEAKDPMTAVRAVRLLRDEGASVTLDVYGRGGPRARKQLRSLINELGVADCVVSRGIRPGEMQGLYHRYDALLFTSNGGDPLPMTPIEAGIAQLPCILSRDGGIHEIFRDGETCLGFEPGDPRSLAAAVKNLKNTADNGRSMAVAARELLQRNLSFASVLEKVENRLQSAAGRPPEAGDRTD